MKHTLVTTPSGEEFVMVSRADFERLQDWFDAQAHERATAEVARGEQEVLTAEEVREALAAPTPLAFWRRKRGVSRKALSDQIGVSQSYLASLETGRRKFDPALVARFASALGVRREDLEVDAVGG